jgi:hypothetical protein
MAIRIFEVAGGAAAEQSAMRFKKLKLLLNRHSGLEPRFDKLTALSSVEGESSSFSICYAPGCRSQIPSLAGIKSSMTGNAIDYSVI